MKQMMDQNMNMEMANSTMGITKTESKGTMIGMICCSILAIAGIGFGVYEYLQANQTKQQIADLKVEIKNSDGSTTTLETDKIEVKDDTKTVVITDTPTTVNTKDYIYIGEWGLKVSIPHEDKFREFSYAVAPYRLYLWGAKTIEQPQATTAFGVLGDWNGKIVNNTFLGMVAKKDASFFSYCEAQNNCGTKIMDLGDGWSLVWFDSESAISEYQSTEDYAGQLQESITILKDHFTDPTNYSAI